MSSTICARSRPRTYPRRQGHPLRPTTLAVKHASLARRLLAATKRRGDKTTARRGLGVSLPDRDGRLTPAVDAAPVAETSSADGEGDWLLVAAARRAEPDLLAAFAGLGASA